MTFVPKPHLTLSTGNKVLVSSCQSCLHPFCHDCLLAYWDSEAIGIVCHWCLYRHILTDDPLEKFVYYSYLNRPCTRGDPF